MKRTLLWGSAAAALFGLIHATAAVEDDRGAMAQMLARAEIAALPVTYAWAIDGKNIDSMMSIFAENAVYDLSTYGRGSVAGRAAIRDYFLRSVFQAEKCSFSSISNVRVDVEGARASGGDYFLHFGYGNPTYQPNTRHHVEGQHFYEFVKEDGRWKISRMRGRPTFERVETFDPASMRHCP